MPRAKAVTAAIHEVEALRFASDMVSRAQIAGMAGLTFSGRRDLYGALGYRRVVTYRDLMARYERGDIAARLVEAYPKETWRVGVEIIDDEDPEVTTDLEQAMADLNERLYLWVELYRLDVLAGQGEYAGLVLGAEGDPAGELPKMSSQEGILYLQPYGQDSLKIDSYDEDPASPRFGQPQFYALSAASVGKRKQVSRRLHWSRVLHAAHNVLDNKVIGKPHLLRVWNRLDDLDKVVGGGAEAFWLRANQGHVYSIDKDTKFEAAQLTKLKEEADELAQGMRRTMALRGATVQALGSDVANFVNQITGIVSLISGATGIPQRILLGSERGELASTQDAKAWDDRVGDRREQFATPLVRQFVDRLIERGALPPADDEKYDVRWPEFEELTLDQKAGVAGALADLNKKSGGTIVLPEEIRDRVLGWSRLTKEQLAKIEEEKQAGEEKARAIASGQSPNAPPEPSA
jgi:hypothetical protein